MIWIVLGWLACSFVTTGTAVAYFDSKFGGEYRSILAFSIAWSLFNGPWGMVASIFLSSFYQYGWRILPK